MKILVVAGVDDQVASALDAIEEPGIAIIVRGPPETDLTNPASLDVALKSVKPDVVICSGAYTAVDLAETNAELAQKNQWRWTRRSRARLRRGGRADHQALDPVCVLWG